MDHTFYQIHVVLLVMFVTYFNDSTSSYAASVSKTRERNYGDKINRKNPSCESLLDTTIFSSFYLPSSSLIMRKSQIHLFVQFITSRSFALFHNSTFFSHVKSQPFYIACCFLYER